MTAAPPASRLRGATSARSLDVAPGERAAVLWSFTYFFCLLASYYLLRPVREEMGITAGIDRLPWLFTGTFLVMLLVAPLFGALAARCPRRTLLPLTYAAFILCILVLFGLLRSGAGGGWGPAAFFIWLSVFNLFVVSVFWSFMADIWREEQARRVFGLIAAGGSTGALVGPALAAVLARPLGPLNLLPVAAATLAGALLCVARLRRWAVVHGAPANARGEDPEGPLRGSPLAGLTRLTRSRYLAAISGFVLLSTSLATVVYFQQAHLVRASSEDPGERTALFALMDLAVNVLTLGGQVFLTGRLVRTLGLPGTLAVLPALSVVGFALLARVPTLGALVGFQVLRRAAQYAVAGPAREMLFTVVDREAKYKAKNVIDTVVVRGGDALAGWALAGARGAGVGTAGLAALALPLAGLWVAVAWSLGRHEERLRTTDSVSPAAHWEVIRTGA